MCRFPIQRAMGALSCVVFSIFACPIKGQEPAAWPCWMGADHSGVSVETMPTWPENGLPIQWSKEVGTGFSSTSIVDGCLYTMGIDLKTKTESVFCLDAESGETIWTHSYPSEVLANLYEGGPGSTPTVDEGLVFALGKTGQLNCLDAKTGRLLWEKQLQEDLGVPLPEWGFNSSGYVLGDHVIFEAGRVVAYHKQTGRKQWQSEQHRAGYGSAAKMLVNSKTYLVTLDCDAVRVTDATNGKTVDAFPWKSPFGTNSTTPIVQGKKIFVSTGYQVGCGLFQFANEKLDLIYDHREMRNHFNNSILHRGYLYGFDGNSNLGRVVHLVCMDFESGKVRWRQRGFGCGSLTVADDKLLILSDKGELSLAEASPNQFKPIAKSAFLSGRCWTVPVYFQQRIYGRNATGTMVCASVDGGGARKTGSVR